MTMIHNKTKNLSFLQTAADLKRLGVQNHSFFLTLHNESLEDVDPFDRNLTPKQKMQIHNEVMINPWYYLRECVRFPWLGGSTVPFVLHRANLAAFCCLLNSIDHYTTTPRQLYRTSSYTAIMSWLFSYQRIKAGYISPDFDAAAVNLSKTINITLKVPQFIRMPLLTNHDRIQNPISDSEIQALNTPSDRFGAEIMGKDLMCPIQFFDNAEFINYFSEIWTASAPVYYKTLKDNYSVSDVQCRIISSTYGHEEHPSTEKCMHLIDKSIPWDESFYDTDADSLKEYIRNNSAAGLVFIKYDYQQLGQNEEWFNNQCQVLFNDQDTIRREILLKRSHEIDQER